MSYRSADSLRAWSCSQAVSKPVWHIPLLCVHWKTPDVGQRKCPKHVEFYSKNKFEKIVHLLGFFKRICHNAPSSERLIRHRRCFLQSGTEYCCMVSSRFWRHVLLGCYSQFYRLVDVPVSARYIEPNAGIQSPMNLTMIFAFAFAEACKNNSSDCANTHVAHVTVPACAVVLLSEVMKTRVWFYRSY